MKSKNEANRARSRGREPQDGNGSRAKYQRRRISLACNACRARKSKCSGDHPCNVCIQLGFVCEYQPSHFAANVIVRKELVTDFEDRLKALENAQRRQNQIAEGISDGNKLYLGSSRSEYGFGPLQSSPSSNPVSPETDPAHDCIPSITSFLNNSTKDSAVSEMTIAVTEGDDSTFFGPSSNTAFMRQITRLLGSTNTKNNLRGLTTAGDIDCGGAISVAHFSPNTVDLERKEMFREDPHSLPDNIKMDELIDDYFMNTGLLYPYIHESTFREYYEQMKATRFAQVRRTWLALLNIILATSVKSAFNPVKSPENRISEAFIYYQRAVKICGDDMYRGSSLEIAQCLLLMAQHLQSTQDSVQTWCVHGLAVKAAMSLGLHSSMAMRNCSEMEQEMRVRVWYGCVMLDRSLYEVLTKVISTIYNENLGCEQARTTKGILSRIVSITEEVEEWWSEVPYALKWHKKEIRESIEEQSLVMLRFQNILKLRFLNLQILAYRPVILMAFQSRPVKGEEDQTFSLQLIRACISKVVQCSVMLISIVHDAVLEGQHRELLDASWFSVYYTFNAAITLFAAFTLVPGTLDGSLDPYIASFNTAIIALEHLDPGDKTIRACAEHLRRLLSSTNLQAGAGSPTYMDHINLSTTLGSQSYQTPGSSDPSTVSDEVRIPNFGISQWHNEPGLSGHGNFTLAQFFNPGDFDSFMTEVAGSPQPGILPAMFNTSRISLDTMLRGY